MAKVENKQEIWWKQFLNAWQDIALSAFADNSSNLEDSYIDSTITVTDNMLQLIKDKKQLDTCAKLIGVIKYR